MKKQYLFLILIGVMLFNFSLKSQNKKGVYTMYKETGKGNVYEPIDSTKTNPHRPVSMYKNAHQGSVPASDTSENIKRKEGKPVYDLRRNPSSHKK